MHHQLLTLAGVLSLSLLGCIPQALTLSPAVQDDIRTLAQTLCHPCLTRRISHTDPPTRTTRTTDAATRPSEAWDADTAAQDGPEGE
jgi:hypothetical protein